MIKTVVSAAFALVTLVFLNTAAPAATLDDVRARGALQCGVSGELTGFSTKDDRGSWSGFDVDLCRAIAAAVFGDAEKINIKSVSAKETFFDALISREVDVLLRATWTMARDAKPELTFAGVNFYDRQGFMVPKDLDVKSALELSGALVCTNTGTSAALNVADFFTASKMQYDFVDFETTDEVVQAYDAGRCKVFSSDLSGLHARRLKLTNPADHIILPETIAKKPLGPVVRRGDIQWANLVRWTQYCMLNAEELGVTSQNLSQMQTSDNPAVRHLLGAQDGYGGAIGAGNKWCANIIALVGNYGESFARHLGPKTGLSLERGLNALWKDGGLQYAPPVR